MKPAELFDLTGRVAVVTGAAGHLGRPIASALAAAGAIVWLVGRTEAPLRAAARAIESTGGRAFVHAADVTSESAIESLESAVRTTHDRLDVLISNAHVGRGDTLATATARDFVDAADLATGSFHRLLHAFRPQLASTARREGSPSVIAIASMYGSVSPRHDIYPSPRSVNPPYYGAAKAALIQLCRYAAVELAPEGVRVNSISPGPFPQAAEPAFEKRLGQLAPAGRVGKPSEIVTAALYLASPFSSFTTGSNVTVDGGWTAW